MQMPVQKQNNNSFFRQLLFIIVLSGMGLLIFFRLNFFLSSFLGALTIYMIVRPLIMYFSEKKKYNSSLVSLALIILVVIFISFFGFGIFRIIEQQISSIDTSSLIHGINEIAGKVNHYVGFTLISQDTIMESRNFILKLVSGLLNTTYGVVANFFMMLLLLYFIAANARKLEATAIKYSPFSGESMQLLKIELKSIIQSNAIGIPVIIFFQSLVAALGYWIFGVSDILFWAFMTALFGLVPLVGSTLIWLPLGVYLFSTGNQWQGIILIIYGALIISNIDNVCRLVVMKKMANTHPLITILGVMIGIPMFGFWGIIFGPLLISGFLLLLKIYSVEYSIIKEIETETPCEIQDINDSKEQ